LHKLLISGTPTNGLVSTSTINTNGTTVTTSITPELARLPGGAELNILPANGSTLYHRSQPGKMRDTFSSAPTSVNLTSTTSAIAQKVNKKFR
jgi:hypothetical protein